MTKVTEGMEWSAGDKCTGREPRPRSETSQRSRQHPTATARVCTQWAVAPSDAGTGTKSQEQKTGTKQTSPGIFMTFI